MSFQGKYAKNKRLHQESSAWRLLRADNAPVMIAFLDDLFADKNEVSISDARVSLDTEIRRMRDLGAWNTETNAITYLRQWIEIGWLREMNDMLTKTDSLDVAIRFTQSLDTRSVGTSASHLRIVQEAVRDFAAAISPDVAERLAILKQKQKEIESEISALEAGEVRQLSDLQQREGIREIFNLARILPADFRLVEDEIRERDQALRVKMIQDDMSQGQLLVEAMDQEDLLFQTEAGSAFEGFYTLLCDDSRNTELREHLKSILSKPIAAHLTPFENQFLSKLMRELTRESQRVFKVRARTESALRTFVESGAAKESRAVNRLMADLEQVALSLKENNVNLRTPTSIRLTVGGLKVASPLSMKLRLPEQRIDTQNIGTAVNKSTPNDVILRALEAVNTREVAINIRDTLLQHGPMTVADLAVYLPIRSGLEELVAYVRVARAIKSTRLPEKEEVTVMDRNGDTLKASVPRFLMNPDMFPSDMDELAL